MVHFDEMRHLVGDDIVEHRLRGEDQPPAEGEVSLSRAAAPPALRIAYGDPRHSATDPCGQTKSTRRQYVTRREDEVVAHPPRQMSRIAADPDLAIDDFDRRSRVIAIETNPVENPEHRHDGSLGKRYGLRQRPEACGDPFPLCRQKSQTHACRDAARQNQLDLACDRIDAHRHPPRAPADPDRDRSADCRFPVRVYSLCPAAMPAQCLTR